MFVINDSINKAKLDVVRSHPVAAYVNHLDESYDICENPVTQGLMCTFKHNGEWYFADISFVDDLGRYECAIFHSDEEGEVSDWKPLCTSLFDYDEKAIFCSKEENEDDMKRFHAIRSKDLIGCIENFVKGME